jgi:hypothetical protein
MNTLEALGVALRAGTSLDVYQPSRPDPLRIGDGVPGKLCRPGYRVPAESTCRVYMVATNWMQQPAVGPVVADADVVPVCVLVRPDQPAECWNGR